MPLDRLDGFTFAADYEAALREFDHGFRSAKALTAGKLPYGTSVGMTPLVVRDGVIKGHVFARMEIATGLISEDEGTKGDAFHLVIRQLAHVAYIQLLEEAVPGAHSMVLSDNFEAFLFPHVETGWSGYFGARASALFAPRFGVHYRALLTSALKEAQSEILPARLAYRFDGDLDRFLGVALSRVGAILSFAGQYLGHYDGLGLDAFEDEETNNLFEQAGLRAWADLFRQDLASVWDRRGVWRSVDEFLLLNRHAERVLWQFGVFPWKTSDGQIRVEVPLISDAPHLTGIRPALRGLISQIGRWGQKALARIRKP